MRQNMLRYWGWVGVVLIIALALASGCTRSKSSGPPEPTATAVGALGATQTPGEEPSPTISGEEEIAATTTAWVAATATAEIAESPEAVPTDTSEPEGTPEATVEAPTQTPEATSAPETEATPAPTQPPTSTEERTHVVQPGENLFRISLQYGLGYQQVAAYNGITNPNIVRVGQEIKIPPSGTTAPPPQPPSGTARYHIVKPGENLFRIALQYNMLYTTLAAANGLSYPYTIVTGQRLIIP